MSLIWSSAHCLIMFSSRKGVPPVGGDGDLLALRTAVIEQMGNNLNSKIFHVFLFDHLL